MSATRTVTLNTMDHGPVTFECPAWCIGHGWQPDGGIGRNDITHNSVRVKATADTETTGPLPLMTAWVSWAPFIELVPRVALELYVQSDFEAEDIYQLTRGLRVAGMRLEKLAAEAIRLREDVL